MYIDENKTEGALVYDDKAPSIRVTSDALLEVQKPELAENSHTGVSTRNAQYGNHIIKLSTKDSEQHWYALRTTYGREKKAYDYIIANKGIAFYPTIWIDKLVNGRIKSVEVSRLPNIFFAYGTENEIKRFVYDNVHLPFLRFYYRHLNKNNTITKEPLIVPDKQIESLRIVCAADGEDTIVTTETIEKFQQGQLVRVVKGPFEGVIGHVARYSGQQRVGIVIEEIGTVITAYVPSAFILKET